MYPISSPTRTCSRKVVAGTGRGGTGSSAAAAITRQNESIAATPSLDSVPAPLEELDARRCSRTSASWSPSRTPPTFCRNPDGSMTEVCRSHLNRSGSGGWMFSAIFRITWARQGEPGEERAESTMYFWRVGWLSEGWVYINCTDLKTRNRIYGVSSQSGVESGLRNTGLKTRSRTVFHGRVKQKSMLPALFTFRGFDFVTLDSSHRKGRTLFVF